MADVERALAVFIDFENLALGFQGRRERFDISRVLERLVEKGKIVVKKAYADWNRFSTFTHALHEAAIELIEIPRRAQSGKNSADIRLCVDAMDLAYSKEHIDTFVVLSGDSDFSPLVSKLKELGKHVIGLGMQESTSDLLRDNCDEFIYYEDLGQETTIAPTIVSHLPETKQKAFALLLESLQALRRENKDVLWSSMIKDTIKRKKPSFNETYHGYRTFSEMLEDAQKEGILELETDKRSRTYVVRRFGTELHHDGAQPLDGDTLTIPGPGGEPAQVGGALIASPGLGGEAPLLPGRKRGRRRRRRGSGPVVGNENGSYPQHTPIPPGPASPALREGPASVAYAAPVPPPPRPPVPPVARPEPPMARPELPMTRPTPPVAKPEPLRVPAPPTPRQPPGFDAGLEIPGEALQTPVSAPAPRPAHAESTEPSEEPAPARRSRARTPKAAAAKPPAAKTTKAPSRSRSRKKPGAGAEPEGTPASGGADEGGEGASS